MVDSYEVIVRKYQQNLRGLFKLVRTALDDARTNGYEVIPSELCNIAENYILERDPEAGMIRLASKMTNKELMDNIMNKNANFFLKSWKSLISDTEFPSKVLEIADKALNIYDDDGKIAIQDQYINKIFEFFASLFKVSAKMVLNKSGIKSMKEVDGYVHYELEKSIHPLLDSETVSFLINKYKVIGVPKP